MWKLLFESRRTRSNFRIAEAVHLLKRMIIATAALAGCILQVVRFFLINWFYTYHQYETYHSAGFLNYRFMNRVYLLNLLSSIMICMNLHAQEPLHDKVFFANSLMKHNYFYSEVAYTSPSWVKNERQKLPVNSSVFFTPGNALELNYTSSDKGRWEAKIFYRPGRGVDFFVPATHLSFRLFIQSSNTAAENLPQVGIGNRETGKIAYLSLQKAIKDFRHRQWLTIEFPLTDFEGIDTAALQQLDVVSFRQGSNDGIEHQLFIDQVELVSPKQTSKTLTAPVLKAAKGYERHVDISWSKIEDGSVKYVKVYRSSDNKRFYPVGIQSPFISRFADYTDTIGKQFYYKIKLLDRNYREGPFSNAVSATTHPMNDSAMLDMVQEANFRYYWEGAERSSGLALENIHGRRNMIASGASGFGIMALIAGVERKFITREQAVDRFDSITQFLERADKFHGAFAHFMDGKTGRVEPYFGERDNGGDLVETSFLVQGLLAARQYFNSNDSKEKAIRERLDRIWRNVEWDWYKKEPNSKFLYWHWSPDKEWIINHKLIGWNETMITYVLAICSPTHPIPPTMYYTG